MKLGCNYWASHAGLKMWKNWDPGIVIEDLDLLSEWGIKVIRIFPLWPEVHMLEPIYGGGGKLLEIYGDISGNEIDKLDFVIDAAADRGIEVIVSLINGWMSGRLFVPSPFYNRNVITDPLAIRYQVIYVQKLVESLKHHDNIIGWDLGNECNVMGEVNNHNQAWLWMNSIYKAIKEIDSDRNVYAGMHGLDMTGNWRIKDVAENCDVMTTHPYPLFTEHCGKDSLGEGRSIVHPVAETKYYSDISGKPCIIEEMGSLGPDVASDYATAAYLREVIELAVTEDIPMLLWWCAFDQPFDFSPYGDIALERELGIFTKDKEPKALAHIFRQFSQSETRPKTCEKAICILSGDQDTWKIAYGTYILSNGINTNIDFAWHNDELQDADIYMLPCITGYNVISRKNWMSLIEKVNQGACLYISYDGGFLSEFSEVTGVCIDSRKDVPETILLEDETNLECAVTLVITSEKCNTVIYDLNNEPFLTRNMVGKGTVYFCRAPVEANCVEQYEYKPYGLIEIYRHIFKETEVKQ